MPEVHESLGLLTTSKGWHQEGPVSIILTPGGWAPSGCKWFTSKWPFIHGMILPHSSHFWADSGMQALGGGHPHLRLCTCMLLVFFRSVAQHGLTDWEFFLDSMGGGAWPFLVGGVICLVNSVNERDLNSSHSVWLEDLVKLTTLLSKTQPRLTPTSTCSTVFLAEDPWDWCIYLHLVEFDVKLVGRYGSFMHPVDFLLAKKRLSKRKHLYHIWRFRISYIHCGAWFFHKFTSPRSWNGGKIQASKGPVTPPSSWFRGFPPKSLEISIWSNYRTRPHPKWWFSKGNLLKGRTFPEV